MKRLLTTTALGMLLVASPALAQTSPDTTSPATPQVEQNQPAGQPDSATPTEPTDKTEYPAAGPNNDKMKPEASSPDTAQTGDTSKPDLAKTDDTMKSEKTAVLPAEMQASKLIGVSVENASGETIGEINDILLSEDGSVKAALVGVGGFLGLGQKNVAIDLSELNIKRDDGNNVAVTVAMSAESLEAMPAYKDPNAPAKTSTGTSPMKNQDQAPAGGMTSPTAPKTGSE